MIILHPLIENTFCVKSSLQGNFLIYRNYLLGLSYYE